MTEFSTARLVLRPPEEADAGPLMTMDADPEVMRYIGTGAIIPPNGEWALQAIGRWRQQWDERGFGMCSVIIRATGEYAGWVTLSPPAFLPEIMPAVEIGWRLAREHWGQGTPPRRPPNCCGSGSPGRDWSGSSASAMSRTCGPSA